jgi:redox-sensitive bicupin YhaK (pirin superfamily)
MFNRSMAASSNVLKVVQPLRVKNGGSDGWLVADPWLMVAYHGDWGWTFPEHPHSGFETVTCVLPGTDGFVDHADSMGNTGRYGAGDVQWMTAGNGVSHSEVSVHSHDDRKGNRSYRPSAGQKNPTGWMFQLWLNLPIKSKLAQPTAVMLWNEHIPVCEHQSRNGAKILVRTIAGPGLKDAGLAPPPDSWAADPANAVQVLHVWMEMGAEWDLPRSSAESNCTFYVFGGGPQGCIIASASGEGESQGRQTVGRGHGAQLSNSGAFSVRLSAVNDWIELLVLEGMPINEPVVRNGPMVTESDQAMWAAMSRYHRGEMGEWSHNDHAPVHVGADRFADYGARDKPPVLKEAMNWPAIPQHRI